MRNEIFLSLLLGFLLDCLVGDPHSIPHPVVLIGKLISALEKGLRKLFPKTRAGEMTAGGILWVLTVAVSFCVPLGLLYLCGLVSPWLRLAVSSVMCWQVLAAKSLKTESMKVYTALKTGTIEDARYAVSMIVGRDTQALDDKAVARAAVETVAENCSDGVIAPMLYFALGGAPLAFAYKAVNTMDSMLGYVEMPYRNIGCIPAKLDDVFNYIPARLSGLVMLLAGGILKLNFKNGWENFQAGPLQPCKPQFRPDRIRLRRASGPSSGRGRLVSRRSAQEKVHRRRPAGDHPGGHSSELQAHVRNYGDHAIAVPGGADDIS